jgi:hypothetical protein
MPKKNQVNPNQMELSLNGKASKKTYPNGKGKKRRFPIANIQQRLIKIKRVRATRLAAEEHAQEYHAVIKDLRHMLGKVSSKNARKYIQHLEEEQMKETALARSYARTGIDQDMVETHESTADHIHRYADTLKRKYKIR